MQRVEEARAPYLALQHVLDLDVQASLDFGIQTR
jgi:hypothetical protein